MEVIPGSHRMLHDDAKLLYALPQIHAVKILMSPGDCLLRDGNMLHRETPNLTPCPRILLDETYGARRTTDPVCQGSSRPPAE